MVNLLLPFCVYLILNIIVYLCTHNLYQRYACVTKDKIGNKMILLNYSFTHLCMFSYNNSISLKSMITRMRGRESDPRGGESGHPP